VRKASEDPLPLPHNPFPAGLEAETESETCWLGSVGAALTYVSRLIGLFAQCETRDVLHYLSLAFSSPLWCGTPQHEFSLQRVLGGPRS